MITYDQFWKGSDAQDRRVTYASDYSPEIEANGKATVDAINPLYEEYLADTGRTIDRCSSGWRPPAVNEKTANAGPNSAHIMALAIDGTGEGDLEMRVARDGVTVYACSRFARWCAMNQDKLKARGLYMEDWHYTAKKHDDRRKAIVAVSLERRVQDAGGPWAVWGHLTTHAPGSGRIMYLPFNPAVTPPPISLTEAP